MRIQLVSLFVSLMLCPALVYAVPPPTHYQVALGDSLAVGVQPSASGENVATNQGYADDLHALFRTRVPGLSLIKLGCSGETTTSMIHGGVCSNYPDQGSSQLAAAISFLKNHKNQVSFVTLDIGADDLIPCSALTAIDALEVCIGGILPSVSANLNWIVSELREAGGAEMRIVAMNYYDPFLAEWKLGSSGQTLAEESVPLTTDFNSLEEGIYHAYGIPVADVATAYRITNFTEVPVISLPLNVFLTLTWTWMGAPAPIGPNTHPNAAGYAVIAAAFVDKIAIS
jgi:lysophospholipase L1-like esterase